MERTISNILHDFALEYRRESHKTFLKSISDEETKAVLNNCIYFSFASIRDLVNDIIEDNKYINRKNKEKLKYFNPDEFMGITRKTTKNGLKINYSKLTNFSICKRKEVDPLKIASSENIMYDSETLPKSIGRTNRMSNGKIFLCGTPNNGKYLCSGSDVIFEGYHPILLSETFTSEEYSHFSEEYFHKLLEEQKNLIEFDQVDPETTNNLWEKYGILDFQEFMRRFANSSAHNKIIDKGNFYILPELKESSHKNQSKKTSILPAILIDKHWLKAMFESLCNAQDKSFEEEGLIEGTLSPSLNLQIIGNFGSLTPLASNGDETYIKLKSEALLKIVRELDEKKSLMVNRKKKSPNLNLTEIIKNKIVACLEPYQQQYDAQKSIFVNNFLANEPVAIKHMGALNQIETILALQSAYATMNELYLNMILAFRKDYLNQSGYEFLQQISASKVFDPLLKQATRFNKETNLARPNKSIYRGMIIDNVNLISTIRNSICHASYFIEYNPAEKDCKITFYRTDSNDQKTNIDFKLLSIEKVSINSRELLRILNNPIFKNIPYYSFIDDNESKIEYGKSKINNFSDFIDGKNIVFSSRNLYQQSLDEKNYFIDEILNERCNYIDQNKDFTLGED